MDYILVPINFKDCATNAAEYALKIANQFQWSITLLHVITPQFVVGPEQVYPLSTEEVEEVSKEKLVALQKSLLAKCEGNVTVDFKIDHGFPPDCITKYSKEEQCALVVMGTKGAKGLKKMLLGSMSSQVMKKVEIPLILIPEAYQNHRIENILFATNFFLYDEIFAGELMAMAKLFDAKLYCMHLSNDKNLEKDQEKMADLRAELLANKYDVELVFDVVISPEKDTEEAIDQYMSNHDIDLLAIHSLHRINLLHQLDHPSIARKFALDLELPLLVFS